MVTHEDLQAIGELIDAKLQSLKQDVKDIKSDMVTKADLSANNHILGTIVRTELAATNNRIGELTEAVKAGFQEVVGQINLRDKRLDDHEDRIKQLEENNKFLPH